MNISIKISLSLAGILISSIATACSCQSIPLEEQIQKADYIYIGKIVESKLTEDSLVVSQLEVLEKIKGNIETTTIHSTGMDEGMCRLPAVVAFNYIIYGYAGKTPKLTLCGSSQPLMTKVKDKLFEINQVIKKLP
jgi:hypothetical protein